MEDNIAKLINRILTGEEEAFSILVRKYQKKIHALAWRKIGDYHIAEEITQDTFIKVYNNLSTLKNPKLFDGWVYVIVNHLCYNWLSRNKDTTPFLEDIPIEERDRAYISQYQSQQWTSEIREHYREVVQKLLEKLPESERTVITLYYLGEMSVKDIGKFLGVSANTIKSRLHRARNRLQVEEHLLISEAFGGLQLSTDMTESVMKQVSDIKPTPQVAKPFIPWLAFGTAAVLVILLLGMMSQRLGVFQKPYNFDAQSEPTIEIVESPIHINIESKPALRNQMGNSIIKGNIDGEKAQVSEVVVLDDTRQNVMHFPASAWKQINSPQADPVYNIFANSKGQLYGYSWTGVYTLNKNATSWRKISERVPTGIIETPITEYRNALYVVGREKIYISTDDGISWKEFSSRPIGTPLGLIIQDRTSKNQSLSSFVMYIAMQDKGVFHSTDAGRKWTHINDSLTDKKVTAIAAMGKVVFIGTNKGLYRLISDDLIRLPILNETNNAIHAIVVDVENLIIATGHDFLIKNFSESMYRDSRKIFRSEDQGLTWSDITPKHKYFMIGTSPKTPTHLIAKGTTLLALGIPTFQSTDAGQTWTHLEFNATSSPTARATFIQIDENTFYKLDKYSIHRTIDGGLTWQPFMNGIVGTNVQELIAFNNRLYVYTGSDLYETISGEYTWMPVRFDYGQLISEPTEHTISYSHDLTNSKLIVFGNSLYLFSPQGEYLDVFRLRWGEAAFSIVQRIPQQELYTNTKTTETNYLSDVSIKNGEFASFFIEYNNRLLKLDARSLKFSDTGLIDTTEGNNDAYESRFKVAASAGTVYVGKQDGKLFQSVDEGQSWKDITLNLPINFSRILDMVFSNGKIFLATDKGVLSSHTGEYWRMLTDDTGKHVVIDNFAVDGLRFYGVGDLGVFRLVSESKWQQVSSRIPDKTLSVVLNGDKLYVATKQRGIFHISLQKKPAIVRTNSVYSE